MNNHSPHMEPRRFDDDCMKWTILESEYIVQRPWLTARRDKVRLPDGRVHPEYYVLEYPEWVNIIAETTDGQIILERQYRHGNQRVATEIPAGCVEPGEQPLQAAQRELWEETGYTGGEWISLGILSPNSSAMTNYNHPFLARGVRKTSGQHLDATEDIHVFLAPKEEVLAMLRRGDFLQALMVAPLWRYFAEYTSLLQK